VVIGIIALLVAILLPALGKARKQAQSVQCLSNLRTLTQACLMWTNENHGWAPVRAGSGLFAYDPVNTSNFGGYLGTPAKNPITNTYTDVTVWAAWKRASEGDEDMNITYSAIAKYLNHKQVLSKISGGAYPVSDTVAPDLQSLFRCPADNLERMKQTGLPGTAKRTLYSYSMNDLVGIPVQAGKTGGANPANPAFAVTSQKTAARAGFTFNGKWSSIKRQGEIVMLVCEDERTIDDMIFTPNAWAYAANQAINAVADRHSVAKTTFVNGNPLNTSNQNATGNASFCDGHAEIISRKDAMTARYSGNPYGEPNPY